MSTKVDPFPAWSHTPLTFSPPPLAAPGTSPLFSPLLLISCTYLLLPLFLEILHSAPIILYIIEIPYRDLSISSCSQALSSTLALSYRIS